MVVKMIIKEIEKRDVLDLAPDELSDAFANRYVNDLYNGRHLRITCEEAVDTFIYVSETAHPKSRNSISDDHRLKLIYDLEINLKSGLISNGIEGASNSIYHTISMVARAVLATERKLKLVRR
jgi:hypothetical protein